MQLKTLIPVASLVLCFGVSPAAHAHNDIELLAEAWDICQYDPGFAVLGYGNFEVCLETVYNDLLNAPPEQPPSTPGGFCPGGIVPC